MIISGQETKVKCENGEPAAQQRNSLPVRTVGCCRLYC
nr:MAG TPA: hypothetical protein [Bacteriophage sp.]